jgi:hypothetical protein
MKLRPDKNGDYRFYTNRGSSPLDRGLSGDGHLPQAGEGRGDGTRKYKKHKRGREAAKNSVRRDKRVARVEIALSKASSE